jgi:hypothetical protein
LGSEKGGDKQTFLPITTAMAGATVISGYT